MTLAEALTRTKDLLGIPPEKTRYDEQFKDILQESVGETKTGEVAWRYYITVAFMALTHQELLPRQGLISADNSKFVDPTTVIKGWLELQKRMDCKLKYDSCWSAKAMLKELNGKKTKRFSALGSWELAIA